MAETRNWLEFVQRLSTKLFADADEFDREVLSEENPERIDTKWLGFAGTTVGQIESRKTSLGIRLPDDYRAFLLATNGFCGLAGLPHGSCSLLPIEELAGSRRRTPRPDALRAT
jgi:hypothetical protein